MRSKLSIITISSYDAVTFDLIRPFGPPSPPGEGYFSHRRFGVWNLSGRGMPPPLQCLAVSVSHFAHAKIKPAGKNSPCGLFIMYGALSYFRKPRLRMMAGSLALPEQIWKKQMTFSTSTMARHTPPTMGTMRVQNSRAMTMVSRMMTTSNFRA